MTIPLFVAALAPFLSSINLIPQLYKIYKTKRMRDLSFHWILLLIITSIAWLLHGYFIMDFSVIASSVVNLTQNILLCLFYILYH